MYTKVFDLWFARNYDKLKEKVLPLSLFGEVLFTSSEDVFHDAFLVARESVLSNDEGEFLTIFLAAYKRQSKRHYRTETQEIRPSDLFWSLLRVDETDDQEGISKEKREDFAKKMKRFAFVTFSADEYKVFEMYFKNGFTCDEIGGYYGVSGMCICKRLGTMKQRLLMRFVDDFENL